MGWAARTHHVGPGMRGSALGKSRPVRALSIEAIKADLWESFRIGKGREAAVVVRGVRMLHKPSGHGKGKWQHTRSFIAYKRKQAARNATAAASRAVNRSRR